MFKKKNFDPKKRFSKVRPQEKKTTRRKPSKKRNPRLPSALPTRVIPKRSLRGRHF